MNEQEIRDKTQYLTGRIVQRILDKKSVNEQIVINHGVNNYHNLDLLIKNIYSYFPNCNITIQKLEYGFNFKIELKD